MKRADVLHSTAALAAKREFPSDLNHLRLDHADNQLMHWCGSVRIIRETPAKDRATKHARNTGETAAKCAWGRICAGTGTTPSNVRTPFENNRANTTLRSYLTVLTPASGGVGQTRHARAMRRANTAHVELRRRPQPHEQRVAPVAVVATQVPLLLEAKALVQA